MFLWTYWPKNSLENGMMFLRNVMFHPFETVSWNSVRNFPQLHSLRYTMLQGIVEEDYDKIQSCLDRGWDINQSIDHAQKFNAVSLAAHLDKLEVLHFLDMRGADISGGSGKYLYTPLMTSLMSWNVRVIDYLLERGVNPYEKDSFGFTALQKAKIK